MGFGDGLRLGGNTTPSDFKFGNMKESVYKPLKESGQEVTFGKTQKGGIFAQLKNPDGSKQTDIYGGSGKYQGSLFVDADGNKSKFNMASSNFMQMG